MNIPSVYFIYINILIGIIYLILIIIGYKKGFLFELVSFAFTIVAGLVSWFVSPVLASLYPIANLENLNKETELVSKIINLNALLNTAIYFILTFLVLKLFYFLLAILLKGMNKIPVIGKFNQLLGGIAGIFNATIITLVLSLLLSLPIFSNGNEVKNGTVFKYISNLTDKVLTILVDNVDLDNLKNKFENFDVNSARDDFKDWLQIKK